MKRMTTVLPMLAECARTQEDTNEQMADSVCAIVVAYFPDNEFTELIQGLRHQVAQVVIVDNTPDGSSAPCLKRIFDDATQVHLIENRANVGIAAALNQGLEYAQKNSFTWALTLDQDTQCYPDMADTLLSVSKACKPRPMVIGGNYLDPRNNRPKVPSGEADAYLELKTVITSGCLIDVGFAVAIGGFREDYFIDQVDHEFCLRARARGKKVLISCKPVMTHSVGTPGGVRLPLLGVLPNHPPVRKYYIARNTVVTLGMYWRQEPEWCLRRLVRLLLGLGGMAALEKNRLAKVRAFAAGISDGIFHRLGPCRRKWLINSD